MVRQEWCRGAAFYGPASAAADGAAAAAIPCLRRPAQPIAFDPAQVFLLRRYDGQVFVKPPEVLARDRLLGTYEVKPVLGRLR